MITMKDWSKKDLWTRRHNHFTVEVSRHTVEPVASIFGPDETKGSNRWAVYAYIYPTHPRFAFFAGPKMFQAATEGLPLHLGPSFLKVHRGEDGNITCYQVGADYNHDGDTHFTLAKDEAEASEVFWDATRLYDFLAVETSRLEQ